ncbi:unnamed protein product [Protopolystoma xenopodis]|uniref:Uncharacterized protein n=1 Tax=Protopolystoma xenopodis TaxID=117903 RepID=A0A448X6W1_9PLAT|nr:unnamed protein product [Protopolystoma xenopodis]
MGSSRHHNPGRLAAPFQCNGLSPPNVNLSTGSTTLFCLSSGFNLSSEEGREGICHILDFVEAESSPLTKLLCSDKRNSGKGEQEMNDIVMPESLTSCVNGTFHINQSQDGFSKSESSMLISPLKLTTSTTHAADTG